MDSYDVISNASVLFVEWNETHELEESLRSILNILSGSIYF